MFLEPQHTRSNLEGGTNFAERRVMMDVSAMWHDCGPTCPHVDHTFSPTLGVNGFVCKVKTASFGGDVSIYDFMNPAYAHCAIQASSWREIRSHARYKTGGLGKLLVEDSIEVWVCDTMDTCNMELVSDAHGKRDFMCYAFDEGTHQFLPLTLNSQVRLVRPSISHSPQDGDFWVVQERLSWVDAQGHCRDECPGSLLSRSV